MGGTSKWKDGHFLEVTYVVVFFGGGVFFSPFVFCQREKSTTSIEPKMRLPFKNKGAAIVAKGQFRGTNYQLARC